MAANNVLDKQVPIYHRFVDNQVLTDDQLNQVIDHINYQDKLTRTGLIGVGIVCGLGIKPMGSNIQLQKGIAVTTDGDLLKRNTAIFKGFKEFKDENVRYPHFTQGETGIDLYELEEDASASDVFALNQFQSKTGIAKERMVALLYLESFLKEEEDCSPVDCNAQGREVTNNLRVLVTSIDAAKRIAEKDSIFSGIITSSESDVLNTIDTYFTKRVVINSGSAVSLNSLKNAYFVQFSNLFNRIGQLGEMNIFKPFANESGFDLSRDIGKLKANDLNFQYIYDLYKDLATAYNELLSALHQQYTICCPDPTAFPKHVLLGEVFDAPTYLRHNFYPSPIHNDNVSLEYLQSLFKRIMMMIKFFTASVQKEVQITPSRDNGYLLAERALPYYYNTNRTIDFNTILNGWNLDQKRLTPNYFKKGYPNPDFEPLDYCFDDHNFYRVEGHVGQNVISVVKDIQGIRDQKGLAFDIIPIAVGANADEDTLDYDKYSMYFEDLQVILQAWNEEQKCLVSGSTKFLTRFSAVEKGAHLDYKPVADNIVSEELINPLAGTSVGSAMDLGLFSGLTRNARSFNLDAASVGIESKFFARPKKNTVLDELDVQEDSVGGIYGKEIIVSDGGSDIELKIENALKDKVIDWDREFQVAVAEIPANLLGKLKVSEDNKLIDIEDFTEENLAKYIKALQAQCKAAREAKKKLQGEVSKAGSKLQGAAYVENYFFTLNRIIASCCLVERVKVLYEKILERKQQLLGKMVLKEYVKSHPGAEHKAGVAKGGTLIVLYYSSQKTKTSTVDITSLLDVSEINKNIFATRDLFRAKTEPSVTGIKGLGTEKFFFGDTSTTKLTGFVDPTARFTRFDAGTLNILREREKNFNLSHGTVIGDLCLPYICCTDMPATTFVYPDQEVNLFIGKDHICVPFEGSGEQVQFEVTPSDATVTAFSDETELSDTIIKRNDTFFFDPNPVDEALYGKPITFKVNGQNVDAQLRVLRQPQARFTVSDEVIFRNDNTVAVIEINNTSPTIAGQEFTWDFDQGAPVDQNATVFSHSYKVKPGETFTFNIELTAKNASCTDSISQVTVIEVPRSGEDPANCEKVVSGEISQGKTGIDIELEQNPSDLKEVKVIYERTIAPIYTLLFEDISKTLAGDFDTKIFDQIETAQKAIIERLTVNRNAKEQEFLLRLFYEHMLIFFYVQACREGTISVRRRITGSWVPFTKNAVDSFRIAMRSLLEIYPVDSKLQSVRRKEDARLSDALKEVFDEVLNILKR